MFNYVSPFLGFWNSRARDLSPAAPDNSKTRQTNKNNKIEVLLFIPRLKSRSEDSQKPKTKQLENNNF